LQLFELVLVSKIPPQIPLIFGVIEWRRAAKKLIFWLVPVEDVYFAIHKGYLLFPSLTFGLHLVGLVWVNVTFLRDQVLIRLPYTLIGE